MGLLDDLKKQAESAKGNDASKTAILQSNIAATDGALQAANKYLSTLSSQLNVLKPVSNRVYLLDQVGDITGLMQSDFFADSRSRDVEGKMYVGQVLLNFRCALPKPKEVRRNFDQIEAFHKLLARVGVKYSSQPFKNERGVVTHEIFKVTGEFLVQVLFDGDHVNGVIKITAKNLSEFGFVSMMANARDFNEAILDELTKIIIGQPSDFWKLGKRVAFTGQAQA
jgi:hypothetical protein